MIELWPARRTSNAVRMHTWLTPVNIFGDIKTFANFFKLNACPGRPLGSRNKEAPTRASPYSVKTHYPLFSLCALEHAKPVLVFYPVYDLV
jgi:hypothetical protein